MNVTLQTMEWGTFLAKLRTQGAGPVRAVLDGGLRGSRPGDVPAAALEPVDAGRARTAPSTRTTRFDEVLAQARHMTDQAKRAELYREAQRLLHDDPPWIFIDHEMQIAAFAKRVQGFKLHPSFDLRVETISPKRRGADAREPLPRSAGSSLLVPVLLGVSVVVFLVLHLSPGDPAEIMLGSQATQEDLARLRADLGLDEPLPVQYVRWIGHVLQGDLGRSIWMKRPVLGEVLDPLPGHPAPHRHRAPALHGRRRRARRALRHAPELARSTGSSAVARSSAPACRCSGWASC